MRGKVIRQLLPGFVLGITPAYAGKRKSSASYQILCQDHPRLCGEKQINAVFWLSLLGSPPPMRGKEGNLHFPLDFIRITPAYAGKSGLFTLNEAIQQDHPRLCGEKRV